MFACLEMAEDEEFTMLTYIDDVMHIAFIKKRDSKYRRVYRIIKEVKTLHDYNLQTYSG